MHRGSAGILLSHWQVRMLFVRERDLTWSSSLPSATICLGAEISSKEIPRRLRKTPGPILRNAPLCAKPRNTSDLREMDAAGSIEQAAWRLDRTLRNEEMRRSSSRDNRESTEIRARAGSRARRRFKVRCADQVCCASFIGHDKHVRRDRVANFRLIYESASIIRTRERMFDERAFDPDRSLCPISPFLPLPPSLPLSLSLSLSLSPPAGARSSPRHFSRSCE